MYKQQFGPNNFEKNKNQNINKITIDDFYDILGNKEFKTSKKNRKKYRLGVTLAALGFAAALVVPIAYIVKNQPIEITVNANTETKEKFKYNIKKGSKVSDLRIIQIEGYTFAGFFKDEQCLEPYEASDKLSKSSVVYAAYVKNKYMVTMPTSDMYSIVSSDTFVEWNENFTFTLYAKPGYDISEVKVEVNGTVIYPDEVTKEYVIKGIKEAQTIVISGVKQITNFSLNVDGVSYDYYTQLDVSLAEALSSIETGYNEENTAGWFTDENFIYPADLSQEFTEKVTLFTKTATLEKLNFALNEDNESYSVKCLDTNIEGEIVIPSYYNGKPVTSVASDGFHSCFNITSVVLPTKVKRLESFSFQTCKELTSINFLNGIEFIGGQSFELSKLKEVVLPNTLKYMYAYIFSACSKLVKVVLPASLTTIKNNIFSNCRNLVEIYNLSSVEISNILGSNCNPKVIHTSLEEESIIEEVDDCCYYRDGDDYVLIYAPETEIVKLSENTTKINSRVFYQNYKVKQIEMWPNLKEIASEAFRECENLISVDLPESLQTIGNNAFHGCLNLEEVNFNENSILTTIGEYAFASCNLKTFTMPNSVTTLERCVFQGCSKLESVTLSNNLTKINASTFAGCSSLKSIIIPASVKQIIRYSFTDCNNLKSVKFIAEDGYKWQYYDKSSRTYLDIEDLSLEQQITILTKEVKTEVILKQTIIE